MVSVTLNGARHDCRISWNDLTLRDLTAIYKEWKSELAKPEEERDYYLLFAIVNNIDYRSFVRTPVMDEAIYNLIAWIIYSHNYSTVAPKQFTISGVTFDIPESIRALSFGQNIVLKQLIDKATYKEELLADAIAVYCQPLVDKAEFKYSRAKELKKEILKMPAADTYALGFFLLAHVTKAGHGLPTNSSLIRPSLTTTLKRMWQQLQKLIGSPDSNQYRFFRLTANYSARIQTESSLKQVSGRW